MTRRIKLLAALALPGLLLAGSLGLQPASAPPDSCGASGGTLERELQRCRRLDEDGRFLTWTTAVKSRITQEVIRRRLGLLEGAAILRALDARLPARLRPVIPAASPGPADEEEHYCRSVLGWAKGELKVSGDDAARYAELEAELEEALGRPGPLRLPDVSLDRCLPPDLLPVPASPPD